MAAGVIAGKFAQLFFSAAEITCDEWSIKPTADDIKDQSSTALGVTLHDAGFSQYEITFRGYWNVAQNPHSNLGLNLRPGVVKNNTRLVVDSTLTDPLGRFLVPLAVIQMIKVTCNVAGRVELEGSLVVDGAIKFPGEA